jgi:(p)ppGpp synthase/HD superfamily hydrolase
VPEPAVPERAAADPLAREPLSPEDRRSYAAAIALAEERHAGQLRKGTAEPYLVHPLEAAALLARYYPERRALVTAGFLHDTLEDTRTTGRELADRFGAETAGLVAAVTRRWWHAPWRLDVRDPDVVRLKAADCVSNIRATIVDLRRDGPSTWRRFAGGERAKRDYYRRLARAISAAIPGEPLATRLSELEAMLEAERPHR